MLEIEKGIPIPSKGGNSGKNRVYPTDRMEIGDSFFISGSGKEPGAIYVAAANDGIKVTCRAVDGGFRVWRVA